MTPFLIIREGRADDADARWARALEAAATGSMPIGDRFRGDRHGRLDVPSGPCWSIGSPIRQT